MRPPRPAPRHGLRAALLKCGGKSGCGLAPLRHAPPCHQGSVGFLSCVRQPTCRDAGRPGLARSVGTERARLEMRGMNGAGATPVGAAQRDGEMSRGTAPSPVLLPLCAPARTAHGSEVLALCQHRSTDCSFEPPRRSDGTRVRRTSSCVGTHRDTRTRDKRHQRGLSSTSSPWPESREGGPMRPQRPAVPQAGLKTNSREAAVPHHGAADTPLPSRNHRARKTLSVGSKQLAGHFLKKAS